MPNLRKKTSIAPRSRVDISAPLGICVAVAGILAGLLLEGGKITDVAQATAALIVLGGTFGAVMITTPFPIIVAAARRFKTVWLGHENTVPGTVDQIISYAGKARKNGIVSLEGEAREIEDPFLNKALMLAVDGTELQAIRNMMELEIRIEAVDADIDAKVYEAAGGYAPTIGIIGAVLGLIQVMKHLDDIAKVGSGIAVAFVATIYGVGSANLIFLPIAQNIRLRAHRSIRLKELMLEGVCSIAEGTNPRLIRRKLEAFSRQSIGRQEVPIEIEAATKSA